MIRGIAILTVLSILRATHFYLADSYPFDRRSYPLDRTYSLDNLSTFCTTGPGVASVALPARQFSPAMRISNHCNYSFL